MYDLLQVFSKDELQMIADLCIKYDVLCISDDVYEWLVYSDSKQVRIGRSVLTRRDKVLIRPYFF